MAPVTQQCLIAITAGTERPMAPERGADSSDREANCDKQLRLITAEASDLYIFC